MLLVATEICLFATRMCCEGTADKQHQGLICPSCPPCSHPAAGQGSAEQAQHRRGSRKKWLAPQYWGQSQHKVASSYLGRLPLQRGPHQQEMVHPPLAGSCFGAAAVPCVLPPAERGLRTPPLGLCMVCGRSEQTWGIWAPTSRALPSSGLAVGTALGFHGPDGAAFALWMVPRRAHSSDSHPLHGRAADPPPKPAAHPGESSLRAQGLREHTSVRERGSVHTTGSPANNKQGLTASLPLHIASSFSGSRRGLCI